MTAATDTATAYAAGQSAAYTAAADLIAAGFPLTEDALRTAAANTATARTDDDTATGTPEWLEELLASITGTQRDTYRALGSNRVSVQVLAHRLNVTTPAAGARVGALIELGLAERTGHGVYRAVRH